MILISFLSWSVSWTFHTFNKCSCNGLDQVHALNNNPHQHQKLSLGGSIEVLALTANEYHRLLSFPFRKLTPVYPHSTWREIILLFHKKIQENQWQKESWVHCTDNTGAHSYSVLSMLQTYLCTWSSCLLFSSMYSQWLESFSVC